MKLKPIILIIFFCFTALQAQFDTDAIRLNISHIPNSNLKNAAARADLTEVDFQSFTPTIRIGKTTKLNSIINYRLYDYNFDSSDAEANSYPDNMHHFKYVLLIRQKINDNWNAYIAPRLNIRTDLKTNFNQQDLFPALTAMFVKNVVRNPHYKYGIGLNFNNNNGKFRVLPTAYFHYQKDNMKISAFIPSKASIMFSNHNAIYGFGYHSESNITHLNLSNNLGANPNKITYLRNMNVFVYPSYSRHLGSDIWATLKAGITILRLYEQYDSNFNDISEYYNDSFKPNVFFSIGFSYKVDDSKK
ncbi:DUF6268 family outer membrane beta-barrel protein [Flavobacterium sp. J27]|uniref:DUF6268 family outer membrane beta-barrel protein n=1 Tax=Flavobacterium sp. J27 TaxID=2060419 RepID=UPI00103226F1|nr:DUF6268 family outer membrane beta-barrel protein [Flavobacterium sp. J27]